MNISELDGNPYDEAEHIYEVMQRGNPLKGLTLNGGIIQIEQTSVENAQIVLKELAKRQYDIVSPLSPLIPSGFTASIRRRTKPDQRSIDGEER